MSKVAIGLLAVLSLACNRRPIASEYPAEVTAFATERGKGVPYLVGKDLRPVWKLEGAPAPRTLLPFQLKDQLGQNVSLETLRGKVAIVSFFFAECPSVCPMTTRNLKAVQEAFKADDRVILLSLSVSPERDTPEKLAAYGRDYQIDPKRWHLLTGNRESIYRLARESFNADTYSAAENAMKPIGAKDFLHSENVYLLDREQKLRGIYAGRMVASLRDLTRDARILAQ